MIDAALKQKLAQDGYVVVPDVLSSEIVYDIVREIDALPTDSVLTRKLLDAPWCQALAEVLAMDPRLSDLLPERPMAAQCILFTKTTRTNWLVSLHQDVSIPVAERVESTRCSAWSIKEGSLFVQPPTSVLEEMVALRVHLDDCNERNGALRVVPGSHLKGRLPAIAVLRERERTDELSVPVRRGGIMAMRPLLLHASSKASIDAPRRVLHFVYGPADLPEGLRWPARRQSCVTGS